MADSEIFVSHSPEETLALGARFALRLHGGDVVAFEGDLGSGKTHFIKGICAGLGYDGLVTSPTFALINDYPGTPETFHIDLYRLETAAQLAPLGLEELVRSDSVVLIEWPELAAGILPDNVLRVQCSLGSDEHERIFVVETKA